MAHFGTLMTPTSELLPSLVVWGCLVLAPYVNFFP